MQDKDTNKALLPSEAPDADDNYSYKLRVRHFIDLSNEVQCYRHIYVNYILCLIGFSSYFYTEGTLC